MRSDRNPYPFHNPREHVTCCARTATRQPPRLIPWRIVVRAVVVVAAAVLSLAKWIM